jgi:hypothetical protein
MMIVVVVILNRKMREVPLSDQPRFHYFYFYGLLPIHDPFSKIKIVSVLFYGLQAHSLIFNWYSHSRERKSLHQFSRDYLEHIFCDASRLETNENF